MELTFENLDRMTPEQEDAFFEWFTQELANDDGSEAKRHLAAGNPIYYCDPDTPEHLVIKKFPDGRRQLVSFLTGNEQFVADLDAT